MKHRLSGTIACVLLSGLLLSFAACTGGGSTPEAHTQESARDGGTSAEVTEVPTEDTEPINNQPNEESMTMKQYSDFMSNLSAFPVSFTYNGTPCTGLGEGFTELSRESSSTETDKHGFTTVVTLRHEASGAEFRLETQVYPDYDAWDYTLYITNGTDSSTGVFADINAIDMTFTGTNPVVKGISGDCGKDMYSPYTQKLSGGRTFSRESTSGRPTRGVFPYFKLEYGEGGSFICIGWPGCWKASAKAERSDNTYVTRFTGGQYEIATYLEPGETIRTPLIAILNYETRDDIDIESANLWRHWFINCNMHTVDGENMSPMFIDWTMSDGTDADRILRKIRRYNDHDLPVDCYWMDAGWYTDAENNTVPWSQTGTLHIDESRFANHFADISAELAKTGSKLLLWFEPEVIRVNKESFLTNMTDFKEEWMLGTAMAGTWLEGQLMDLGNPECRQWISDRICTIIADANIAVYRQDFNVDPAPVWNQHNTEGRTGICENKYVMGYLALWDGILERFPGIWIDSCASGGGRNDLETMRRAVPLQISDYWDGGLNNPSYDGYDERQATMLTVMQWFPYIKYWMFGDDSVGSFTYRARSCYTQVFPMAINTMSKDTDWELVKRLVAEWRVVSSYFYDDFYPLTEWNNSTRVFRAYEYFSPEKDSGIAQVFRPSECEKDTVTLQLMGLCAEHTYHVYDTDGTFDVTATGQELMTDGISPVLPEVRYAMVLMIEGQ